MVTGRVGLPAVLVLLAACAGSDASEDTPVAAVAGAWEAMALPGAKGHPRFELADGKLTGHSGCNGMSGSYVLGADGSFRFGDVVTTKMYCEGEPGASERIVLDAIAKTAHVELDADTLMLQDARRAPLIALSRAR